MILNEAIENYDFEGRKEKWSIIRIRLSKTPESLQSNKEETKRNSFTVSNGIYS